MDLFLKRLFIVSCLLKGWEINSEKRFQVGYYFSSRLSNSKLVFLVSLCANKKRNHQCPSDSWRIRSQFCYFVSYLATLIFSFPNWMTFWEHVVPRRNELYKGVLGPLFMIAMVFYLRWGWENCCKGPLSFPPLTKFSLQWVREFEIIRDLGLASPPAGRWGCHSHGLLSSPH